MFFITEILEMSENSHRELWTSVSRSDDESVSLLPDMNGHQNTVAVEDAEKGGSHTQGVIVPKEKLDNKLFPLEKVKGVKCNYDHSSVANQSTSQSGDRTFLPKIESYCFNIN